MQIEIIYLIRLTGMAKLQEKFVRSVFADSCFTVGMPFVLKFFLLSPNAVSINKNYELTHSLKELTLREQSSFYPIIS